MLKNKYVWHNLKYGIVGSNRKHLGVENVVFYFTINF